MTQETREAIMRQAEELTEAAAEQYRPVCRPDHFVFDPTQDAYWHVPTKTLFSELGVNKSVPKEFWRVEVIEGTPRRDGTMRPARERLIKPADDISATEVGRYVDGNGWFPGEGDFVLDRVSTVNGIEHRKGARTFNTYRPPAAQESNGDPGPWLRLLAKVYPEEKAREYFLDYCAHMVQRPWEKCNAAILLCGEQRIGKDSILAPLKMAVGMANGKNIDPDALFASFKPWIETVMLTIDEVRPSSDDYRASTMYKVLKPFIAAPPDTLELNQKYQASRWVTNVMRVFLTTNDWLSMYIPPGDERFFVLNSPLPSAWATRSPEDASYFTGYFEWLYDGGFGAVAEYLRDRDISSFNPKGGVPKTEAWGEISNSWENTEDEISQVLDSLGMPEVVFPFELLHASAGNFDLKKSIEAKLKSSKGMQTRMNTHGYVAVPYSLDPDKKDLSYVVSTCDGRWKAKTAYVTRKSGTTREEYLARIALHSDALKAKALSAKDKQGPSAQAAGKF